MKYVTSCNTAFIFRCVALLYFLPFTQKNILAQKKRGTDELYSTQLKAAEAYYRLHQIGEAKNILLSVPENKRTFEWQLLYTRSDRSIQALTAHSKPVAGIAASKDGKLLATGSADSSIIIWDASTYQVIRRIAGHKGQVTTLDFSPDGKTLISGSTDKSLRLWNVIDGTEIRDYNTEFKQGIYQVKFSNDGTMLGVVSWEFVKSVQGFAKVLEAATGKLIQRFDTDDHPAAAIKFSADDKKIYTGTWGFQIRQHDIMSGHLDWNYDMREFDYYTAVQSLDVSPDNKFVIQGGKDNKIRILDAADGKLIRQIESWEGHKEWVNGVRFSPDGKHFASVSDDGLLKVWETATAKTLFTFKGHIAGMNQLAWHPDGKRIFTTSVDNTIRVWDINSPGEINFTASIVGPWNAPVSPDGKWMAPVNSDKVVALYDLTSGKQHLFLDSLTAFSSVFSSDGKYLATGNRSIIIYDIAQQKKILTGKGHTGVIYGMDYNRNLDLFLTAADKTVRVWNTKDTAAIHIISTISNVFTAKFSPDGKNIYAGCTNGKVKIISTGSWTVVDSLQSGTTIFNMAVSAGNKYLITGGNAEVFAWDIKRKKGAALKGHTKWVYGVAFHPALPLAVTVSYDRTVRFWDVEKGINTLTLFGFEHELYTVTFTSDGKKLVLTETGGLAHVINL